MNKRKLIVDFNLCVSVEVDEDISDSDYNTIAENAKQALLEKVNSGELAENITYVEEDEFGYE